MPSASESTIGAKDISNPSESVKDGPKKLSTDSSQSAGIELPSITSLKKRIGHEYENMAKTSSNLSRPNSYDEGYSGVPGDENETTVMKNMRKREEALTKFFDWVWTRVNAAFWVGATCGLIYWTNFFRVIWEHPGVERNFLFIAFTFLSFNMSLLAYLALYLQWFKGIEDPITEKVPNAPIVMFLIAILTVVFFQVALTPVWGFWLTFGIQCTFFMGFINSGMFLPGGLLGSVLMFVITFGAFFTSILIPHEGLAHKPH